MDRITLGLICGLAFGIIATVLILPHKYDSSRKKLIECLATFADRFLIGLLIPSLLLNLPPAIAGGLIGLGVSLPLLLVVRNYIPVLGLGTVGGALIAVICKIVMSLP